MSDENIDLGLATKMLDVKQASEMMGLSIATLRAWRRNGKGPAYYKLGKAVRYKESEIIEFIKNCQQ